MENMERSEQKKKKKRFPHLNYGCPNITENYAARPLESYISLFVDIILVYNLCKKIMMKKKNNICVE